MTVPAQHHQRVYRPDIDGMRAIAVLSVLFFHVGFPGLTGGYIGVDVFLVISGYLISGILLGEHARTGRISFREFYYRRLKRIAPALIATVAVTTGVVVWLYSPILLAAFGQSVWMSLASISNIGFYLTSGYFATDSDVKPLLHTWSLSVEEQFYLIWPLILAFLLRKKRFLFPGMAVITVVSLVYSQYQLGTDSDAAFFLMPFRIFEFGIGALLHAIPNAKTQQLRRLHDPAVFVGLVAIGFAVVMYTEETPFPGVMALLPCLGAALLIWAKDATLSQWVLGNRIVVWIGSLSYALYLVHWPIIVLYERFRMTTQLDISPLRPQEQWGIVVASFIAAYLLHVLVESPLRRPSARPRRFVVGTMLSMVLLGGVGAGFELSEGWGTRPWVPDTRSYTAAKAHWLGDRLVGIQKDCNITSKRGCSSKSGRRNALVIGNSHVIDGWNVLRTIYPEDYFFVLDTNGCASKQSHSNTKRCTDPDNLRFNPTFLKQFDYIVFSRLIDARYLDDNLAYIAFLSEQNVEKVVVLGNYYRSALSFDDALQTFGTDESRLRAFLTVDTAVNQALEQTARSAGYLYVDKFAVLCLNDACPIFAPDGTPFTFDKHHLTRAFATLLAERAAPIITRYLGTR